MSDVTLTPIDGDPFAPDWVGLPRSSGVPRLDIYRQPERPFVPEPIDPLVSIGGRPPGPPRPNPLQGVVDVVAAPGRMMQQPQPQAGQMWSDEEEAIRQLNEAAAPGWGAEVAGSVLGMGSPFAPKGAVGAAGGRLIGGEVARELEREAVPAAAAAGEGVVRRGRGPGGRGLAEAQREAEAAGGGRQALVGLPTQNITIGGEPHVPGPIGYLHDLAEKYMEDAGLPYRPPSVYAKLDPERSTKIAQAFEEMPHAPNDPAVRASYDAMARETKAQYQALKDAGIKFEYIKPGQPDPYAETPRQAAQDVIRNKHLWVFPTESGFGTQRAISDNPLLHDSGEIVDGRPATYNDLFRIVHDVFGHLKHGNGFRAGGEENAWRAHSAMYSDLARPAMTSETRGQNSWVNYGPHGEANRKASAAATVYADQKVGLLPDWAIEEGRHDLDVSAPNIITKRQIFYPNGYPIKGTSFSKAADEAWDRVAAMPKGYGPLNLNLSRVTGVPQVPLQRSVPPRGVSPRLTDALGNPYVVHGVGQGIEEGIRMGAHLWYHTEPIRAAFEREFGPNDWQQPFKLFMDLQAAASPQSNVPTQIRNGSWFYSHAMRGLELPEAGPGVYPYGHLASRLHRMNFERVRPGAPGWDVLNNPKPPSFSINLQGNLVPVTVDTHAFRAIGMRTGDPRFLETRTNEIVPHGRELTNFQRMYGELGRMTNTGQEIIYRPQKLHAEGRLSMPELLNEPDFWVAKPNENEYGAAEQFYQMLADRFGVAPADVQAAGWAGSGRLTGLDSPANKTFPELLNERIMYTAHMRGENPHRVLRDLILGHKPLLGIAGAGMVAPSLVSRDWNDPHQ